MLELIKELKDLNEDEKRLLDYVIKKINDNKYISCDIIANVFKINRKTVYKRVNQLEDLGYIKRVKVPNKRYYNWFVGAKYSELELIKDEHEQELKELKTLIAAVYKKWY